MDLRDIATRIIDEASIKDVVGHYLPLVKAGRNFKAACPFHDDTNPSLSVNGEKKVFKCFVCGTGGNAISFVQKYENISFKDAAIKVAEICNINLPELSSLEPTKKKESPFKVEHDALNMVTQYYQMALNSVGGKDAMEYVLSRHISEEQIEKFKIGFCPDDGADVISQFVKQGISLKTLEDIGVAVGNSAQSYDRFATRIIFTLTDENNQVVGFSGRSLSKSKDIAKYMNSPESKVFLKANILYNMHEVKRTSAIKKYVYICEGFMDVIALDRVNIPAVATMGTSLTKEHLILLKTLKCQLKVLMDGDDPGRLASLKASRMLFLNSFDVRVVHDGKEKRDPDEILTEADKEGLDKYLASELTYPSFVNAYYKPLLKDEVKQREYLKLVYEIIKYYDTHDLIIKEQVINEVAKLLNVSPLTISKQFDKTSSKVETLTLIPEESQHTVGYVQGERIDVRQSRGTEKRELTIISMMLQNKEAVKIYSNTLTNMVSNLNSEVAAYLVEYQKEHGDIDTAKVMVDLQSNEKIDNAGRMIAVIDGLVDAELEEKDMRYTEASCKEIVGLIADELQDIDDKKMYQGVANSKSASTADKLRLLLEVKKAKNKK